MRPSSLSEMRRRPRLVAGQAQTAVADLHDRRCRRHPPLLTTVEYDAQLDLGDGITAQFTRAGHILGSASITVTTPDTSVLFSGDLGRRDHPVLRPWSSRRVRRTSWSSRRTAIGSIRVRSTSRTRRWLMRFGVGAARRLGAGAGIAVDRVEVVLRALSQMRKQERIPEIPIMSTRRWLWLRSRSTSGPVWVAVGYLL
ncbi:MAG: hypothetical protein R2709_10205 [Marmoricola sp.]